MKIIGCGIYAFKIPFTKPFAVRGKIMSCREGFILRIKSESGAVGMGEVSPLPGLSPESLSDALMQIQSIRRQILSSSLTIEPHSVPEMPVSIPLFPSVRFGFESAILDLWSKHTKTPWAKILGRGQRVDEVSVIGLLEGSVEDILVELRRLQENRFQSFKLKVGSPDMDGDLRKVALVQEILKPGQTLRLDCNQGRSFKDALIFARALKRGGILYIEEPFQNSNLEPYPQAWQQFYSESGIPLALDESLSLFFPSQLKRFTTGVKVVILKPTVLGGIKKIMEWIQSAQELGVEAVVSSCFESGVGLMTLAQVACAFGLANVGLDTLKYFSSDVLIPPLKVSGGKFVLSVNGESGQIFNHGVLNEVSYE